MEIARAEKVSLADELATLWRGTKGIALGRVECLRRAVDAARRGDLDLDLRAAAAADAHKLAGALGMYGLVHASELALEIDRAILAGALDDAARAEALRPTVEALALAVEGDR